MSGDGTGRILAVDDDRVKRRLRDAALSSGGGHFARYPAAQWSTVQPSAWILAGPIRSSLHV